MRENFENDPNSWAGVIISEAVGLPPPTGVLAGLMIRTKQKADPQGYYGPADGGSDRVTG